MKMEANVSFNAQLVDAFQTIIATPVSGVSAILDKYPEVVNTRVWHGVTLLHQICMRGTDASVISILIERGAEINSRTQTGETPLHCACRKGSLAVITTLLKHGADSSILDSSGHGCMHYAAQGNSVMTMVYLHQTLELAYDCKSTAQQTPLHVAALHGNWQVSAFLLKEKRCDVLCPDIMGNTAIHLAAMKGEVIICCQVVCAAGKDVLKTTNGRSETALHIAKAGTTTAHRVTEKWLKSPTTHPRMLWISNLLLSPVLGCLVPFLVNFWWSSWQLFYWVVIVFAFGFWILHQQHRLTHPSRWSNPARAGVYIWGIVSNLTIYFYYLMTVTRGYWFVTLVSWTSIFLSFFSIISFYLTSPGVYFEGVRDWSQLQNGITGSGFCDECEIVQVPGVRHCRICGKCYRSLQHHCLFLLKCVTRSNECSFTLILFANLISCFAYVLNVIVYLELKLTEEDANPKFQLLDHVWMLVLFGVDIVCGACSIVLIRLQLTNPYGWRRKHEHNTQSFLA